MRIRSPLTESKLYARDRGSRNRPTYGITLAQPQRQLFRLVILLILVVVLIQRAGDPAVYQRLFRQLGITPPPPVPRESAKELSLPLVSQGLDLSPLTQRTSESQSRALARWLLTAGLATGSATDWNTLYQKNGSPDFEQETPPLDAEEQTLASSLTGLWQSEAPDFPGTEPACRLLDTLLLKKPLSEAQKQTLHELLHALDQTVVQRMKPTQLLTHAPLADETYLATRGEHFWDAQSAEVGILPLLQQAPVYKGQWVQLHGRVAQTDLVSQTPSGPLTRVWLNPADGSRRPVVITCLNPPPEIMELAPGGVRQSELDVVAQGWFATRATYAAVGGVETAPLLIGNLQLLTSPVAAPPNDLSDAEIKSRLGKILAIFSLVAVSLTWFVYAATKRRERLLRHSHQQMQLDVPAVIPPKANRDDTP